MHTAITCISVIGTTVHVHCTRKCKAISLILAPKCSTFHLQTMSMNRSKTSQRYYWLLYLFSGYNYVDAICVYVCVYGCVSIGHLDVLGEMASRKRSLIYHPGSPGWTSRCPYVYVVYMCMCVGRRGGGERWVV